MHYEETPVSPSEVKVPQLVQMYAEVAAWMTAAGVNPEGNVALQLGMVHPEHKKSMPRVSEIVAYVDSLKNGKRS